MSDIYTPEEQPAPAIDANVEPVLPADADKVVEAAFYNGRKRPYTEQVGSTVVTNN